MRLNTDMQRLENGARKVDLTATEFYMVELLYKRPDRIFSRNDLIDAIDPRMEKSFDMRTIDSHIKRIRRKIKNVFGINPIRTRYGSGYYWAADELVQEAKLEPPKQAQSRAALFHAWKEVPEE